MCYTTLSNVTMVCRMLSSVVFPICGVTINDDTLSSELLDINMYVIFMMFRGRLHF